MFHKKLLNEQLLASGVRLGDGCSILPCHGKKRAFTLNRKRIDIISTHYRPPGLCMTYIEIPRNDHEQFHYRLELDEGKNDRGRFLLKTITGGAFWLNGLAAREAYIERADRIFIDDNRLNFSPYDLKEITKRHFDHPVLGEENLLKSDLNILITGETGTGKSHLARNIHKASGKPGPFVAVNLSSFNPQLIESELFGHKKGAFTGAIHDKKGAFMEAQEGTLFLDEVDSLPLELQTKLLTFIDNKKFRVVGDTRETSIRTRLVFASGRPLEALVEQKAFRKDFFFRLQSGHSMELASLRNDVPKISEACRWFALTQQVSLTVRLIEFYETLAWPGNLRQLFGHLEKKKVLTRSTKLDFDQFDEELMLQSSDLTSFDSASDILPMYKIKSEYAKKALISCEGNLALTARKLKMSEKTIKGLLVS